MLRPPSVRVSYGDMKQFEDKSSNSASLQTFVSVLHENVLPPVCEYTGTCP